MIEDRAVHHAASEAADHGRFAITRRAIHHRELGQPQDAELAAKSLAETRVAERRRIGDEAIRITELALLIEGKSLKRLDLFVTELVAGWLAQAVWLGLGQREHDLTPYDGREHVAFRRIDSRHQKRTRVMWTVGLVVFIVIAVECMSWIAKG